MTSTLTLSIPWANALAPSGPWKPSSLHRNGGRPASTIDDAPASDVDALQSEGGFWHQSPAALKSRLHDPPPDHILAQIRSQPYRGGFEPAQEFERPVTPKIVEGSIPTDLVGTLAINGAGRMRIGGRMLGHWFDGDGYVATLSFDGKENEARVHGRYVRTDRFKAQETLEGRGDRPDDVDYEPPLAFSGAWTSAGRGEWYNNIGRTPQNPANTATMWMPPRTQSSNEPRLFALCEGGHPIELDPATLDVIGEEKPFASHPSAPEADEASSFFSAHFSRDPETHSIYNHGYILDPLSPTSSINLMELSPEGDLRKQRRSDLPYNTFVHDATISQSLYVYFVCPYVVPKGLADLFPFIMGRKPLGALMRWKGRPSDGDPAPLKSYLHVHSRDDLALKWRVELPEPASAYHIVDAYEEARDDASNDMRLKVRIAELDSDPPVDRTKLEGQFANQYAVPSGERLHAKLIEYTFLLREDGSGELMDSVDIPSAGGCEYPATNQIGRKERLRYVWINALSEENPDWFDAVQKVDMEGGGGDSPVTSFGRGTYCGPPLFVPKEALTSDQCEEDEGYVAVALYRSDEHRSDVAILDARSMKTLCRMELDRHLPYSFHGDFWPGFVPP
ncbi:hypothetical protein ACHAWF_012999 [Thalassiosira exigua]